MPKPSAALLAEGFFEFKGNSGDGLCWVKGCRRASRDDRCLCHMHDMRRWRAQQKKTADYCTLRDHAAERKIPFRITLDYWRGLVDAFGLYPAPVDGDVLTIDRVDPSKGYEEGNLRVISVSLNAARSNRMRYLPEFVQSMLERKRSETQSKNQEFLRHDEPSDNEVDEGDDYATPEDPNPF